MAEKVIVKAEKRETRGKNENRRLRVAGKIPVVVVSAKELTPEDRHHLQGHVEAILQKGSFGREGLLREVRQTVRSYLASRRG